jgi:hypothetical protein
LEGVFGAALLRLLPGCRQCHQQDRVKAAHTEQRQPVKDGPSSTQTLR